MTNKNDDYEVGYRKPPKSTQFKKGQSGNSKGRPRSKNKKMRIEDYILSELESEIKVTENGLLQVMTKEQAIAKGFIAKVLAGDARSTKIYFELYTNKILPMHAEIVKEQRRQEFRNKPITSAEHGARVYKQLIKSLKPPPRE